MNNTTVLELKLLLLSRGSLREGGLFFLSLTHED